MTDTPQAPRTSPRIPLNKLNPARRRLLPAASAAAAAFTLAGCALTGSTDAPAPLADAPAASALSPQQKNAEELVRRYTENLDMALDHVDRERLRIAAEKKNVQAAAAPAPLATPAVTPPAPAASVSPAAAITTPSNDTANAASPTVSASVLFATSTPESPADHSTHAAPAAPAPSPAAAPQPSAVPPVPAVGAIPVSTAKPAPAAHAAEPVSVASATSGTAIIEKASPATPTSPSASAARETHAAPLSTQAGGTPTASVISPITIAPGSTPAAMTSMSAAAPAPAAPAAARSAEAAPAITTPISAPPAPSPEPSMDDAMGVLRRKITANPSLNSALALALLDPADAQSTELVKSLPEADQKIFTDLLTALQGMNAPAGSTTTAAERAAPLVNVAKKWQADADLNLPKLVLASRVDSFGVYTAVEPKFEQGRRQTVIIYCEVSNFASTKTDDNWFNTRLTQQETLVTDDGLNLLVWRSNPDEIEDRSLNQRRDFYLVKKLTIPENLAAGKYTLIMSVTDRSSNKHATVNLPIEIVVK